MTKQIMYNYTGDDHRRRLLNIRYIEKNLDSCGKKNFVTDYRPGHYVYKSAAPQTEEEDRALFKKLSDAGVEILQLWSGWCGYDWGGDVMYRPVDPEATRKFLDLAHEYGLKVLPYTSTNFFTRQDDSFNPDWAFIEAYDLHMSRHEFTLAHCSPTSPLWREHLLKQFTGLLDEYDFDGLYIDSGYIRRRDFMTFDRYYFREPQLVKDDVLAFEESEDFDGGMQDLLALIYSEVKKRGGILKFHKEGQDTVHTDLKVYDYLQVGEANNDIDFIRDSVRDFTPYVTPDYNYEIEDEHERYLNTIPFMQFPIVRDGTVGIDSPLAAKPNFDLALRWLTLYKKMTREGTWCYCDAKAEDIVTHTGRNVVTSFFVNLDTYLIVANYDKKDISVTLEDKYIEVSPDGEGEVFENTFTLPKRKMIILKKINEE